MSFICAGSHMGERECEGGASGGAHAERGVRLVDGWVG